MSQRIDSTIVEYNEDGSQTITSIEHYVPPTTTQKLISTVVLVAVVASPAIFLGSVAAYETWEENRAARKAAKKLKSV